MPQYAVHIGPPEKKMVFRWRADDGPTMNAGLVVMCFFHGIRTSIAMIRGGGGPDHLPPSLDPYMCVCRIDPLENHNAI